MDRPADTDPAIAVVPYGSWPTLNPGGLALDALHWPLGRPARLDRGHVRDMGPRDHLLTFPRKPLFALPWPGVRAQVSVMIVEPDAIHGAHLDRARRRARRFYRVLTKNAGLLAAIDNGLFYVYGSTFLEDPAGVDRTKHAMASLIASARRDLEGHKLRHVIVEHIRAAGLDVAVMGRGYRPFADKAEGLAPYRYSVVIENAREPGYFTEKLVDACICDTVPIYWGAPDIAAYFDPGGMIICEDRAAIEQALASMSRDDYERRAAAIAENRRRALDYADNLGRAARLIRDSIASEHDDHEH